MVHHAREVWEAFPLHMTRVTVEGGSEAVITRGRHEEVMPGGLFQGLNAQ
jgi:hypothetical protein